MKKSCSAMLQKRVKIKLSIHAKVLAQDIAAGFSEPLLAQYRQIESMIELFAPGDGALYPVSQPEGGTDTLIVLPHTAFK
jgi:hypothetical protein